MTAQEMEQGFQNIWTLFAETDRKREKLFKESQEQFKETREQFKETDKRFKETDQRFKETGKQIGAITSKWGRFVEGLVAPAAERLFQERGIHVNRTYQRVRAHKHGSAMDVDILAVNGDYAVLIEVKSTLGVEDIREHIERMQKFTAFFPEYADLKVVGAVAGIVIDEDADKFAYRQGLFVIAQSGETVTILNDEKFQPKHW